MSEAEKSAKQAAWRLASLEFESPLEHQNNGNPLWGGRCFLLQLFELPTPKCEAFFERSRESCEAGHNLVAAEKDCVSIV